MPKSKLPVKRVDATACVIHIGRIVEVGTIIDPGEAIKVHDGEWVEVLPVTTVREYLAQRALQSTVDQAEGVKDLCTGLASRVIAWNWTGLMGEVLPQPYKQPGVLEALSVDELLWLARQPEETPEARKNGSAPSGNT